MEDHNDDKQQSTTIIPRPYQCEMLEAALQKNTIVCLNTGSGKTFIAVMLIKALQTEISTMSLDHGGKKTFFLVNTVPLVKQQSKVLKKHTTLKIGSYIGADGVDLWKEKKWKHELESHQVLVMTAAILLQILRHGYIRVRHTNLLIFDECHRGVGNHDYAQIMRDYVHYEDVQKRPVIFGMTASIINGKCAQHQIENKIKALESLMLSRVATTKYQHDLEKCSTKPEESTVFYHQVDADYCVQSILNVLSEYKDTFVDNNYCNDIFYEDNLDVILNSIRKDCLSAYEELGHFGLYQIISLLIAQHKSIHGMAASNKSKAAIYRQILDKLKIMQAMCENYYFHYCQSVSSHPKLKLLLDNLRKYLMMMVDQEDHFCGIIFVEKRCIAMTLSNILNILADFDQSLSTLKCDFVVGHGTGVNSSQVITNMTYKQQACSIDKFRRHEINLLIATNVIEEGIDIPKCNIVIRFNEIKTFSSYMQSKGRARAQMAHFMMMIDEDGKYEKVRQIYQWSNCQDQLQQHCHDREPGDENDDLLINQQLNLIPPFNILSTGSKITMSNSISILNWYCGSLPRDIYTPASPTVKVQSLTSFPSNSYKATITMPSCSPLTESISGPIAKSKKIAKMAAAFTVCKELHAIGQLTDNLIPVTYLTTKAVQLDDILMDADKDDSTIVETNTDQYQRILPKILQDCHPRVQETVFLYRFQFNPCYKIYDKRQFGIITSKRLPEVPPFSIFTPYGETKVSILSCCSERYIQAQEMRQIYRFNYLISQSIFRIHNNSLQFQASDSYSGYLVVPIIYKVDEIEKSQKATIDYDFVNSITNHKETLIPIDLDNLELLKDAVVTRNYSNISGYFEVSAISTERSPIDYMIGGDCHRNFMTYYKERYNLQIKNLNQPLLRVKHLPQKRDMLQSNKSQRLSLVSQASSNTRQMSSVNTEIHDSKDQAKVIEFIPEFCKMSVIPASAWKILACIPSILWRMEGILLAKEVANSIQMATIPNFNPNISLAANNSLSMTILQALTLAKAGDQFNLERLEFLGDSFLKFAIATYLFRSYTNFHEGQLTTILSRFVSNENLCRLGIKLGLPGYIICQKVDHGDSWIPPGYCIKMEEDDCRENLYQKFTEFYRSINSLVKPVQKLRKKSIADVVEALLAATLLQLGEISAYRFITTLNAEIKFDQLPDSTISLDTIKIKKIDEVYHSYKLMEVEAVLGYEFNHRILLLSALTHASYNHPQLPIESYQRLEFLGDAILQYITARDSYYANANYTPADLHDLKEASLQNESLAAITVTYDFHKYLFQRSPSLFSEIHQFLDVIDKDDNFKQDLSIEEKLLAYSKYVLRNGEVSVPKPLGDIFESLVGAIFIDCQRSIQLVNDVVLKLLQPQKALFAHGIPKSPIRVLHEKFPSGLSFKKDTTQDDIRKASLELPDGRLFTTIGKSFKHCKKLLCNMALQSFEKEQN